MNLTRALLVSSLTLGSLAAAADKPGCVDHPLFVTRLPGYELVDCKTAEFDGFEFEVGKGPRNKQREEGRLVQLTYGLTDRKAEQAAVAIVRNYENAMTKAGGAILFVDPNRWVVGKFVVEGREVFAQAERGNGRVWLRVLEKKAMTQHVVADAAAFAKDLESTGHVAVYGIYFDTGKAELKPESKPTLEEIAKLLKADAALKLWVVGHTDWVGRVEDNQRLAQSRAEAVVTALTSSHGVAAGRLKGYGAGPLAPVATNGTDEGRAKNRRVELVKQP